MTRQETALDFHDPWLLDHDSGPPAFGWSHAAGRGVEVSGPAHPHHILTRLWQRHCEGDGITSNNSPWG
jgi:hypothetical protein